MRVTSRTLQKPPKSRTTIWNSRSRRHPAEKLSYSVPRSAAACKNVPANTMITRSSRKNVAPEARMTEFAKPLPPVVIAINAASEPGNRICRTRPQTKAREIVMRKARAPVEITLP